MVSQLTLQVFTSESSCSGSARVCEVFLTCVAASGTNVTYSWGRTDGKVLSMDNHSLFEAGLVLWAKLDPSDRQVSYTCTAANAVSWESATIAPWEHCQRETGRSCFTHLPCPAQCLATWHEPMAQLSAAIRQCLGDGFCGRAFTFDSRFAIM